MKLRGWLTRKNVIAGSSLLAIVLVVAGFFVLRRPPRTAMERYVPADALAFVEIDSLTDILDGLTATKAWKELAPVLGLSSQLKQVGFVTDLIGRTGLGPDEAVVAGRAQCAIAITGIESTAGETEEGAYIHLRPHFVLLVETHMSPDTATRLVRERASIIAARIYGESVVQDSEDYRGSPMLVFHGPVAGRQLLAASAGSVVLLANQPDAMKSVLDVIAGRTASLAEDATLKQMRPETDHHPPIFAYVTTSGIERLVALWPVLLAGRSADSESVSLFADLVEQLSKQAEVRLLYSLEFESGGVTEKYSTVLRPGLAEALIQSLKPAPAAGFESLRLIPQSIESVTLLKVERVGESPERVLKHLSPNLDIVAGVALREFVINLRKHYGLESSDSVAEAVGNEIALVNFGDGGPRAMLVRVSDSSRLLPFVMRYLTHKGASVTKELEDETQIMVSSGDDRRSAAFVGDFLALGTRDQISQVVLTLAGRDGIDRDERLKQALGRRPANAPIISYRPRVEDAGKLLLAISKLTRVTNGSLELLEGDSARRALDRLPPSVSITEFRRYGVYIESHSPVGSLSLLGSLMSDDNDR